MKIYAGGEIKKNEFCNKSQKVQAVHANNNIGIDNRSNDVRAVPSRTGIRSTRSQELAKAGAKAK